MRSDTAICMQGVAAAAVLLLSGCGAAERLGEGTRPDPALAEATRPDPVTRPSAALYVENAETDVAAPAVFENSGAAVWDGRPTLGGVWVAHPLADRPERVLISNTENGRQVKGALFRRDEALGGPAIQLSSDTARALGIEPGAVTPIRIVALRRTVVKPEPAPEPAIAQADDPTAPDAKVDTSLAEAAPQPRPADVAAAETPPVVSADPAPVPAEEATVANATPEDPSAAETESVADEPALKADNTATADTAVPTDAGPSDPVERAVARALAEQAHLAAAIAEADLGDLGTPVPVVATDDIEAVKPVSEPAALPAAPPAAPRVAPQPRPRGTRLPGARKPLEAAAPEMTSEESTSTVRPPAVAAAETESAAIPAAETAETADDNTATAAAPAKPYVRVGIFGVAKNAESLRRLLESQGYKVMKVDHRAGNSVYSHILVGPAADETELRRLLTDMHKLGFRDALPVTG